MVVAILIIFIILFIYLKYPQVFSFKDKFVSGRYVRLEREGTTEPISVANFVIYDLNDNLIIPKYLNVYPRLSLGDGKYPQSITTPTDIVLIETSSDSSSVPYIEYDLGITSKISKIIIVGRKSRKQLMQRTIIRILEEDRSQVFEKTITDVQDMYSINVS